MASAISPVIMFFIKLCAGQSSDRITFISDPVKLRIYNTLAMGLMGFFFIVPATLNPHEQQGLCLVVLITSTCRYSASTPAASSSPPRWSQGSILTSPWRTSHS